VTAASALWIWLARPNGPTLALGTLLLGTFWPLILYLPSTYQESLHCAIALLLAGLARRVLGSPARGHLPFVAVVFGASLIRMSWILVLVPWAIATLPGAGWRSRLFIPVAAVCCLGAAVWAFGVICSPYPDRLTPDINRTLEHPISAFWTMELRWERGWKNLLVPSAATVPIGLLQRYQILAVTLVGVGLVVWRRHSRTGAFAAANVFVVLIATMLFFYMWGNRDYRVMAPHMLLSLLVLLVADWRLVLPFVATNLAFVGFFVAQFASMHRERVDADRQALAIFADELAPFVSYTPNADGWSNTLLFPVTQQDYRLLALPPGIGLTFALTDNRDLFVHPRSKYVVLPPVVPLSTGMRLKLLTETPFGPLYGNLDLAEGSQSSSAGGSVPANFPPSPP
jgi:hypothetical protein